MIAKTGNRQPGFVTDDLVCGNRSLIYSERQWRADIALAISASTVKDQEPQMSIDVPRKGNKADQTVTAQKNPASRPAKGGAKDLALRVRKNELQQQSVELLLCEVDEVLERMRRLRFGSYSPTQSAPAPSPNSARPADYRPTQRRTNPAAAIALSASEPSVVARRPFLSSMTPHTVTRTLTTPAAGNAMRNSYDDEMNGLEKPDPNLAEPDDAVNSASAVPIIGRLEIEGVPPGKVAVRPDADNALLSGQFETIPEEKMTGASELYSAAAELADALKSLNRVLPLPPMIPQSASVPEKNP
ncbi:hypothetical protein [Lacisediminimonas sp.]|uniref:hypothetical protein n=1 Tax=Lacisediminimonas sp. TaxID=3060582 RepID=UPI00271FA1E7|nr:hypothetical protein [Lacisediminimonas sp.]MDO8301083.1 hypothetical protein [Lacisediminimonas sp.]